jgi:hypothetical protein
MNIQFVLTLVLLAIAVWWLVEVATMMGRAPTIDSSGHVMVDRFQRAKDVLLVILPLLTSALGYWFGARDKDRVQGQADSAKDQLNAVVATSSDPELMRKAKEMYPTAFRPPTKE